MIKQTNTQTVSEVKAGRGRPQKAVKFPKGNFTVNTIVNRRKAKGAITFPCVKAHIDRAVATGELVVVGKKEVKGRGRKPLVYTYA